MGRSRVKKAAAVALGMAAFALVLSSCGGEDAVAVQAQTFRVERGDLALVVTAPGSVVFAGRTPLSFDIEGVVSRVFVSEGDRVEAGQTIAELGSEALTQVILDGEQRVAEIQARVDDLVRGEPSALAAAHAEVVAAEQALFEAEQALAVSFLEILQPQQYKVAKAALAIKEAEAAIERARQPATDLEVVQQRQKVAEATIAEQRAEEALAKADLPFTTQTLRQQELAVAEARAAVERAQDDLDRSHNPFSEEDAVAAQAVVADAQNSLSAAQTNFDVTERVQGRLVEDAQHRVDEAEQDYRATIIEVLDISILQRDDLYLDPRALWEKYGADPVHTTPPWNVLVSARADRDLVVATETLELAKARSEVSHAEQALAEANSRLAALTVGPDPYDVAVKEAALEAAASELVEEQRLLAEILEGGDPLEIDRATAALELARAKLEHERATLDGMAQPPPQAEIDLLTTELDLAKLIHGIEQRALEVIEDGGEARRTALLNVALNSASLQLAAARAGLEQIEEGDPLLTQLAVERVEAQASMRAARDKLDHTTLRASAGGIVIQLNVAEGETVLETTVAAVLADPEALAVSALVDEVDIFRVREGQGVRISPDAAPLLSIPGTVRHVSPISVRTGDGVRYRVTIDFDSSSGTAGAGVLREGFSTRVEIVVNQQSGVLSVPIEAVSLTEAGRVVQVVRADETTEPRLVQLGSADGIRVVVTSGVQEGETVLVPSAPRPGIREFRLPGQDSGTFEGS